ncbi:MAG: hypothetical protein JMN27_12900 [gamma proteobacterium endosymbiont of Lamellibrachia anaximandri]|nr:hypothetical protein [gamma proteobacterium endosymbiont of Lamellibrachia anaximandri]
MKKARLPVICFLTFFLSACGEEPSEDTSQLPAESAAPMIRNVPDPAMERAREEREDSAGEAAEVEAESAVPTEPIKFTVDTEGRRVFLPGKGWLSSSEFWDIYYNRPGELPGDIDHQALHSLRAAEQAE